MELPLHTIVVTTDKIPTLRNAEEAATILQGVVPSARLAELAEAGYAPHYRVDGGPPLFSMSDLKPWVARNMVQYHPGRDIPFELKVVVEPPLVTNLMELPASISNIPNLRQFSQFVPPPGVYFLCLGAEVVYVGQSVAPAARVSTHRSDKQFDRSYLLPVPESLLNCVEGAFIRLLRPKLNGHGPAVSDNDMVFVKTTFLQAQVAA